MTHDENPLAPLTLDQIRTLANTVAADLKTAASAAAKDGAGVTGGGSRQRGLPEELRRRFIDVRASLYQRGIYDPVLVRFDTATVTQASINDLASQMLAIASSLKN